MPSSHILVDSPVAEQAAKTNQLLFILSAGPFTAVAMVTLAIRHPNNPSGWQHPDRSRRLTKQLQVLSDGSICAFFEPTRWRRPTLPEQRRLRPRVDVYSVPATRSKTLVRLLRSCLREKP